MPNHFDQYIHDLAQAVGKIDDREIARAADIIFEAWQNKRSVWTFGNGGSWATAEHFALDLRKWPATAENRGVKAQALTLSPLASAYANDHDYDEIFTRQLDDLIADGDVAVGITCGGSPNVLNAVELGLLHGDSICITSELNPHVPWHRARHVILVGEYDIRVVEDTHLATCHLIAGEVKERIEQAIPE